jgi:hypothetical protein
LQHFALETIDPRLFKHFPKLEILVLPMRCIRELKADVFLNASSLTELHMLNTAIKFLEADSFRGLANLRKLSVGADWVRAGAFNHLSNLEELRLCDVQALDPHVFHTLPQLVLLNVNSRFMKSINNAVLDPLDKLEELTLELELDIEMPVIACDRLKKLKEIEF